jgi:hypothetical protein
LDVSINKGRHSSILDVQSFRAVDCDTDHYLIVTTGRERLAVNKQILHRFHMERFSSQNLYYELVCKRKYHVNVSNRFAALEYLYAEEEINSG